MPSKLKVPCRYPGCPAIVSPGDPVCELHRKQFYRDLDRKRPSAKQRGYDAQWARVRMSKLKRQPLCELCLKQKKIQIAEEVHHVNPIRQGGDRLADDNIQSLCRKCHAEVHMKNHPRRREV